MKNKISTKIQGILISIIFLKFRGKKSFFSSPGNVEGRQKTNGREEEAERWDASAAAAEEEEEEKGRGMLARILKLSNP